MNPKQTQRCLDVPELTLRLERCDKATVYFNHVWEDIGRSALEPHVRMALWEAGIVAYYAAMDGICTQDVRDDTHQHAYPPCPVSGIRDEVVKWRHYICHPLEETGIREIGLYASFVGKSGIEEHRPRTRSKGVVDSWGLWEDPALPDIPTVQSVSDQLAIDSEWLGDRIRDWEPDYPFHSRGGIVPNNDVDGYLQEQRAGRARWSEQREQTIRRIHGPCTPTTNAP